MGQECTPYYPRIFWNPASEEIATNRLDHIFMWNTNSSCPYSFIKVSTSNGAFKFRCKEKRIETFNDDRSLDFYHYVQTCSALIQENKDIVKFRYQLFGSRFIDPYSATSSDEFEVEMPTVPIQLVRNSCL